MLHGQGTTVGVCTGLGEVRELPTPREALAIVVGHAPIKSDAPRRVDPHGGPAYGRRSRRMRHRAPNDVWTYKKRTWMIHSKKDKS